MRLIDADRLKAHYCWWSGGTKEMTIDEAKKTFDTIVDVQPTVDAVEVVRCKDCRKWCICHHSDDYYCADAERNEDAKTD